MRFPANSASNAIRGALGFALASAIFRPRLTRGPSGLADPPRAFILCAAHLNGAIFEPGDTFHLECRTFDREARVATEIAHAFMRQPGRFRLEDVVPAGEFADDLLSPDPALASRNASVSIRFLTPAEFKGCAPGEPIPFASLFARIRDRVATLSHLYGDGAIPADFRGLAERAASVHTVETGFFRHEIRRRSSRTGEVHSIGGFTGRATYAGCLAEFAPWLRAACWAGVGRHTVWGNGQIACEFA